MKKPLIKQLGQGMTEYIIIVALIAIAAISIYGIFGDTVREQMGVMTKELAGQDGGTVTNNSTAVDNVTGSKTLKDYNK